MQRNPTSIRLSEEEEAALRRAADDDKRPVSALIRVILVRWLEERGYLPTRAS
jgi:hypothetical protein